MCGNGIPIICMGEQHKEEKKKHYSTTKKEVIKSLLLHPKKSNSYEKTSLPQHTIEHSNSLPAKHTNDTKDQSPGYIIVMSLPYMALYIPWRYNNELDPFYIKLVNYFIGIALERGYNYFSLQRIAIKNQLNFSIATRNFDFLYNQISKEVGEYLNHHTQENNVIIQGELLSFCATTSLVEHYGGFFLLAKSIEHNSKILLTEEDIKHIKVKK
jgi:hypothetical protein